MSAALDALKVVVEVLGAGLGAMGGNVLLEREKTRRQQLKDAAELEEADAAARLAEEAKDAELRRRAEDDSKTFPIEVAKQERVRADQERERHLEESERHHECEKRVTRVEAKLELVEAERARERGECDRKIAKLTTRIARLEGNSTPPPAEAAE